MHLPFILFIVRISLNLSNAMIIMLITHPLRASKLLKSEAETALRHLTITSFGRAVRLLPTSSSNSAVSVTGFDGPSSPSSASSSPSPLADGSGGGGGSPDGRSDDNLTISDPAGLSNLLLRIMQTLSELIDPRKQHVDNVKFFLSLINIALEAGGPALSSVAGLVSVCRGDVCRHLLSSTQSADLEVFRSVSQSVRQSRDMCGRPVVCYSSLTLY